MKELNILLQAQFDKMSQTGKLFRVKLTGREVWDLFLSSFENDPKFRDPASSEHNCNHCNNFIRRYGNVVAIIDNKIVSMFDAQIEGEYKNTVKVLSKAICNSKVQDVFTETYEELNKLPYEKCNKTQSVFQLGIPSNLKRYTKEEAEKFGVVKEGEIREFNHFGLKLDKAFVDTTGKSAESIMGNYRDAKNVFQRAMEEISLDTLELVRDLINQGSLLDGPPHLPKVTRFIELKKEYNDLAAADLDNWLWTKSYGSPIAKFRNELIGTLCVELTEGKELNEACQTWNKRVDPANYMKTTAPITKRQIEEAQKFVEENGYVESFDRRTANLNDIKVSEILHSNVGNGSVKSVSIFDSVKATSTQHKRAEFDAVEVVSIEKFMKDILPTCTAVEAYLEYKHKGNLVTLTTANVKESKPIFKWSNNYSWTYSGNLAGKSQIKEAVKTKGGKVDGVLRFSIMWAEEDSSDNSDLDAWCYTPHDTKIYYGGRVDGVTLGNLDVDITQPNAQKNKNIVENITFPTIKRMIDGTYRFSVNQFNDRGSKGFKAEIEFNGELFNYEYSRKVAGTIPVAEVTLKNGVFTVKHILPSTMSSGATTEIYGLETNKFHKVNLMCLSPNYWGENNVGNKHFFFFLEGCKTAEKLRSFHNENLIPALAEHRKVLEVLGNSAMITPTEDQLSGLGFNATVTDELVVRVSGTHKRVIKIRF